MSPRGVVTVAGVVVLALAGVVAIVATTPEAVAQERFLVIPLGWLRLLGAFALVTGGISLAAYLYGRETRPARAGQYALTAGTHHDLVGVPGRPGQDIRRGALNDLALGVQGRVAGSGDQRRHRDALFLVEHRDDDRHPRSVTRPFTDPLLVTIFDSTTRVSMEFGSVLSAWEAWFPSKNNLGRFNPIFLSNGGRRIVAKLVG